MEVMDSARGRRRGLRLQCDGGGAECLDQREPRTAEREVLAGTQHHVARVVLLGDPDRPGMRGDSAARAVSYAEKSSALQIDFHRRHAASLGRACCGPVSAATSRVTTESRVRNSYAARRRMRASAAAMSRDWTGFLRISVTPAARARSVSIGPV